MKRIASVLCGMNHAMRWFVLFLGGFENWLEGRFVFSRVLLHLAFYLFCAEDAVYIGTNGLEFFVIILEITVSIVLGILLNRKLLFFCPEIFHGRKLPIRRVLLQNLKCFLIMGKFVEVKRPEKFSYSELLEILRKWILWRDTDQGNESARLFSAVCFQ